MARYEERPLVLPDDEWKVAVCNSDFVVLLLSFKLHHFCSHLTQLSWSFRGVGI